MFKLKDTKDKTLSSDVALMDLANSLEDDLIVINSDYRVQFANAAAIKKLINPNESPIGKYCYEAFHGRDRPCSEPLWSCALRDVYREGKVHTIEHTEHDFGISKHTEISTYPLHDKRGSVKYIIELRRDVSLEREAESQIQKRNSQLMVLNHISRTIGGLKDLDSVLMIALDNVLDLVDGSAGGILLLDEQTKTLRYQVQRGLSDQYTEEMQMHLGEGIAGNVAETGEAMVLEDISSSSMAVHLDLINKEGLKGFVSIPLKTEDKVIGVMNIGSHSAAWFNQNDVTFLNAIGNYLGIAIENAKLYERLNRRRKRYQQLLKHALTAQEEERVRIARDLQFETSQAIINTTLLLQDLLQISETKGIKDADYLSKLEAAHCCSVSAGSEIVKLTRELRRELLDDLGFSAAIQQYAEETLRPDGISVSTEFKDLQKRLQPSGEVTFFRIIQGAISNIQEHAQAKNVSISVVCDDDECKLQIKDDGIGFNVNEITRIDPSGRGSGLFTMKERARMVGGRCQIISDRDQGTNVTVWIPVDKVLVETKDKAAIDSES